MFASDEHRMEGTMSGALKWFARTERDEAKAEPDEEPSENTLEPFDLPPHVREFLELKARAGF